MCPSPISSKLFKLMSHKLVSTPLFILSLIIIELHILMKIAFLFMVRDNLAQPLIWQAFFKQAQQVQQVQQVQPLILAHAKHPERVTDKIIKDALIPQYIETEWGHSTLSLVMMYLAHNALKRGADWLIYLSETCVPLQPYNHIYSFLKSSRFSWFNEQQMANSEQKHRYKTLSSTQYIKQDQLKKSSQWCILNKADTSILLKLTPEHLRYYKNFKVPDEHYILTTLSLYYSRKHKSYKFNNGMTTLVDWTRPSNNYKHPHTFNKLTEEDKQILINTKSLFGRRFESTSNIIELIPKLWKRDVTKDNISTKIN